MIGIRLKEERERLGLTQPVFAEIAGAKKRTLIDWEQGVSSPTSVQLAALSSAGVDAAYIITGHRNVWLDTPPTATNPVPFDLNSLNKLQLEARLPLTAPEGFVLVPRYDVTGSMGSGQVIHSEQIVDHLAFRAEWVRTELGTSPKNLVLISAVGDSMEPALRAHDLLLIDRSILSVKQDAIYAFAVDGELRVKRIQRLFDHSLIIKSDNPSYATETLTSQQVEAINIIGRVVWSGRRM